MESVPVRCPRQVAQPEPGAGHGLLCTSCAHLLTAENLILVHHVTSKGMDSKGSQNSIGVRWFGVAPGIHCVLGFMENGRRCLFSMCSKSRQTAFP